jgi:hypothetical protein
MVSLREEGREKIKKTEIEKEKEKANERSIKYRLGGPDD